MSRHHPYSGYDEGHNNSGSSGHRKHGFGSRGSARGQTGRGGTNRRLTRGTGGDSESRTGWDFNQGSDGGYGCGVGDYGSRGSDRDSNVSRGGGGGGGHLKGVKNRGGRGGKPRAGLSKVDHADKEMSIDERIQRERPCRTLFVRNVKYETNSQVVREKFERMGEIKTFFDLISTRGMVFITYYDVRAATMAKERLQGTDVSGRPIDVHYSLPKDNELERRCDRDKNQATLFLAISGANRPIDDEELKAKFSMYGEVRSIKHFKDSPYQRFIEFWDSRACERAHDDLVGSQYLGGKLDLKFSWDTGMVPKTKLPREYRAHDGESGYGYEGYQNYDDSRDSFEDDHHSRYDDDGSKRSSFRFQSNNDDNSYGYNRNENGYNVHKSQSSYDSGNHYQQPLQPNIGNGAPRPPHSNSYGSVVDEQRLDQAHKVQELLASLTKAGSLPVPTNPATAVPAIPQPPSGYAGAVSSSSHAMYQSNSAAAVPPSQPPYPTIYPNYSTPAPSSEIAKAQNPTPAENPPYNQWSDIMGRLSSLTSASQAPAGGLAGPIGGSSTDESRGATVSTGGMELPPSVLALLQRGTTGSEGQMVGSQIGQTPGQNFSPNYHIKPSSSLNAAIPTAPRAMQGGVPGSSNGLGSSPNRAALPSHLGGGVQPSGSANVQPITSSSPTLPVGLSGSTYQGAGATQNNSQSAVHQLLALLQQQQQQTR